MAWKDAPRLRHVLWLVPAVCVLAGLLDRRDVDAASATAERTAVRRALARRLDLPETPFAYTGPDALPAHVDAGSLRRWDNTPRRNRMSDAGVALGRALFYDPLLSATGTVSCASCHRQDRAFSDRRRRSPGVHGRRGGRNAMSLVNVRYHPPGFFWDERADTLEAQVLQPIQDEREMALPLNRVVPRVSARGAYRDLFEAAFGDRAITNERIAKALAQFVRSLVSFNARYDEGLARVGSVEEDFPNFTKLENEGKRLFFGGGRRGRCASCHTLDGRGRGRGRRGGTPGRPALFLGRFPSNNGLDRRADVKDQGIGGRTGDEDDLGVFKSPSLRNVAQTAPYMHDGRLRTLEAVIEHYARAVQPHPNLDRRLAGRGGGARRLVLTSRERRALVAFLKTLTDRRFLEDPRFADPFR